MKLLGIIVLSLAFVSLTSAQQLIEGAPPQDEILYTCPPCGCAHDGQFFLEMGRCPSCNMALQPGIQGLERSNNVKRPRAGIFLFDMADVMDVSGPLSVFEHAGFQIVTFARSDDAVRVGMNLEFKPDFTLDNLPSVDILVFPGGGMAESDPGNEEVVQFIKGRYEETEILFSVCSGAFFLGEAGLLDGQKATTFASLIPALAENYPEAEVLNDVKYTDNGKVVTSAGLSSGIDAAFHVVARYYGVGRAQDIANHMEYPWKRANDYARSQLAINYLEGIKSIAGLFATEYYQSHGDNNHWELRYTLTSQMSPEKILSLLVKELEKQSNWTTQSRRKLVCKGTLVHQVLGEGKLEITIEKNKEAGDIMIVRAERVNKYEG